MHRIALGATTALALVAMGVRAEAIPLVATYSGIFDASGQTFTATFHYNSKDLVDPMDGSGFLDGKPGTKQWATYVDPTHNLTFTNPTWFTKGEYTISVDNDDGTTDVNTVHRYVISGSFGLLDFTFGGVDDSGIVTIGASGLDYTTLVPQSFKLTKETVEVPHETVSPVPLPAPLALFGGALVLLGTLRRARSAKAS